MPRLSGWAALGFAAALVELGLLRLLVDTWFVPAWLASVLAAEALILARFAIADRWVFRFARPTLDRLARYQGACLGALAVYLVTFNAVLLGAGTDYRLAFVAGTAASVLFSLATNFLWVWRTPSTLEER
ncbi:MAG: GtrA family protein [Chloroflexi bacterium]|nr:GtrA family protein [Chloroflexota bacterium]